MASLDIVYKYKTPLESRLLSKQLYGVASEGLVEDLLIDSHVGSPSITLRNISFYYSGRSVPGFEDEEARKRVFHVSSKDAFVFENLSSNPADPNFALGVGVYFPFTGDSGDEVLESVPLLRLLTKKDFDPSGDYYTGYPGMVLCRLYFDSIESIWKGSTFGLDWTDKLFKEKKVPTGLRLASMSFIKDGEYKNNVFLIKRGNKNVHRVQVILCNSSTGELSAEKLHVNYGVTLDDPVEGKYYAVGFRSTVREDFSEAELKVLSPAVGRDTLLQAMADRFETAYGVNYNCALVGVVRWYPDESEITYFEGWNAFQDLTVMSPSGFTLDASGAWVVKDGSITSAKIADGAVTPNKILNDSIPLSKLVDEARRFEAFTFIIDSDQKLKDWADDVAGNDYSRVLIRKRTDGLGDSWELIKDVSGVSYSDPTPVIDISNGRTKCIVGESESKIVINNSHSGIAYIAGIKGSVSGSYPSFNQISNDYFLHNVNVSVSTGSGSSISFYNCANLTNCTGCTSGNTLGQGYGFYKCVNLVSCFGSVSGSPASGYSFHYCVNLVSCSSSGSCYGFFVCTTLLNCFASNSNFPFGNSNNLTNCTASSSSSCFSSCNYLVNCIGTTTSVSSMVVGSCFSHCAYLTNCIGSGFGPSDGIGFSECSNLTSCIGSGSTTSFRGCHTGFGCKGDGKAFIDCFMEQGTSTVGPTWGNAAANGYNLA